MAKLSASQDNSALSCAHTNEAMHAPVSSYPIPTDSQTMSEPVAISLHVHVALAHEHWPHKAYSARKQNLSPNWPSFRKEGEIREEIEIERAAQDTCTYVQLIHNNYIELYFCLLHGIHIMHHARAYSRCSDVNRPRDTRVADPRLPSLHTRLCGYIVLHMFRGAYNHQN